MAEEVANLPDVPVEDDDDNDELTFSKEYRETEEGMLLSAKEADFRAFLCDSGATNEVVRLLVGLGEASERPADPVAFMRAKFDSEELPEMVQGKVRDNIPELLELNAVAERTRTEPLVPYARLLSKRNGARFGMAGNASRTS